MTRHAVHCLHLNPEPWAIGNAFVVKGGRRAAVAPDKTLKAYQEAVRAELLAQGATMVDGPYVLTFWFWRENVSYTDAGGKKRSRNSPDLSNMVKATEDAIQGILIDNDRDVVHIRSFLVERGKDVEPKVVIEVESALAQGWKDTLSPAALYAIQHAGEAAVKRVAASREANTWTPGT